MSEWTDLLVRLVETIVTRLLNRYLPDHQIPGDEEIRAAIMEEVATVEGLKLKPKDM